MTTPIWQQAQSALSGLGVTVAANALVLASGSDYPDSFIVHFMVSDPTLSHADNVLELHLPRVQVSIYSRTAISALATAVQSAMIAAGFYMAGARDLPYNPDTRHFGTAIDFTIIFEED